MARILNNNYGLLKSGFTINNPISHRNEVNMSPEEWEHATATGTNKDYSIPDELTEESIPVASTAVQSARYDPEDNSLNITFKGGTKEYKYDAKDDLQEWINAPSKGRITWNWGKKGDDPHTFPGY